ncbi:MAG TPA: amino acid adenylation domain-containing protein, partial [Candidatus Kapabacteria bacterium]|nr:amino acid adenylation domain-containing protein [Candidatus Kapabacteria bacterium]
MEKLNPKGIENILSLTPLQEGMLFHHLKDARSGLYFEQLSLGISGEIDPILFEKAWNIVTKTNEMLRTVFRWEKVEKPSQIILKEHPCRVIFYDLSGIKNERSETVLQELKKQDLNEGFDLQEVPFRVTLCKLTGKNFVMIISSHHILYDGWSNGIILREFFKNYELCRNGKSVKIPLKTPFKEFVKWIQSQDKSKQKKFWHDYLAGIETITEIPIKNNKEKSANVREYSFVLPKDICRQLDAFSKEHRVTLAAVFYATWGLLLQRYCSSEDIVFGTTISGRSASIKQIENMVGIFINTLPLRVQSTPTAKLIDVIAAVENHLQEREAVESTPLLETGAGSLFDTIMVIENYPLDNRLLPPDSSLSIQSYAMAESTHYDLTVGIMMFDQIEIKFSFREASFAPETIENIAEHIKNILQTMSENPGLSLSSFEIITPAEKNRLLYEFNNTAADYPIAKTLPQLFAEQESRTPDHIALVGADLRVCPVFLTYRQLNEQSNRMVDLLIDKGVLPDMIVAIMMERSVEMIVGIMGILKSGGAYLPIDPSYPQERIDYMLKDSKSKILISKSEVPSTKFETNPDDKNKNDQNKNIADLMVLNFENSGLRISNLSSLKECPHRGLHHSNLAYIIYTSGSTGRPKGVMIEHRSVVNLLFAMQNKYPFTPSDTYLLKTSYTFDVSVTELFGWFMGGGKLAILEKNSEKDPLIILNWIQWQHITHINFVPSMFNSFLDFVTEKNKSQLRSLKYIFLAGEASMPALVKKFRDLETDIELENIYGPTEGTVYSSRYSLAEWNGRENVPIGKSLPNIKLYILNKYNHLQPLGVPGELYISGDGVARGYLNNPALTAEKFRPLMSLMSLMKNKNSALRANFHAVLYRTGDLCQWLSNGNIEFLGRIDQQIKIRGFRVELGEIENRLLKHEQVKDAVVLAKEDAAGDKYLAAYFVSEIEIPGKNLIEYLAKDLPEYMIPSYVMRLGKIPLTPSGKVDRKALPESELKSTEIFAAPRSEIEKKLVEIWGKVLGKDISLNPIGIDDHFFRLGGHSLKATSLVSLLYKTFNVKIPLSEIFKRPTIRQLSDHINNAVKEQYVSIEPVEKKEYYMLSSAQKRLYFLQQMDNAGTTYNISASWVLDGEFDYPKLENTFIQLVQRHESFRTSFAIIAEEPAQRIQGEVEFEIEYLASDEHRRTRLPGAGSLLKFIRPFDLSQAPLMRVGLVSMEAGRHLLMVDMHHIISDGISAEILVREFTALYSGEEPPIVRLQYKDYAEWQRRLKQEEYFLRQKSYWKKEFEGQIPVLEMPGDYARPPVQSFEGNRITFTLGSETVETVNTFALDTGTTLYMVLLASYSIFLAKLSGREDIIIGTPVAGRRYADFEKIIGVFVNTLVLRMYPAGEKSFNEFLEEIKERTLEAFENQDYQYEDLW